MKTTTFGHGYLARPSLSRDRSDLIFPLELDEVSTPPHNPFARNHEENQTSAMLHDQVQFPNHLTTIFRPINTSSSQAVFQPINTSSSLAETTSVPTRVEEVQVPITGSGQEAWLQGVISSTADSDQLTHDIGLDALNAGYSAKELRHAGYSALELRDHGFVASELKEAGFDAKELSDAGYKLYELEMAGYLIQ